MAKKKPLIKLNPVIEPELIKRKFELCRQKDKRAGEGAYRPARCLTEAQVRRFEKKHDIELPEDYRTFLTQVGNGGVGWCDRLQDCEQSHPFLLKYLKEPFPHSKAWNLPKSFFDNTPEIDEENEKESYQQYEEYIDQYWDPCHIQGSLPFSDYGCANYYLMVLNGPERGTIWFDARADDAGVLPIALNPAAPTQQYAQWWVRDRSRSRKKRATFAVFYNLWLDRKLRQLRINLDA